MKKEICAFIKRYASDVRNGSAAVFVGAGISKSSGYVDWRNLLKDIVNELGLDIEKESDLVSLAQYSCNTNGNRNIINKTIIEEFAKEKEPNINHRLLAKLPIFTYWTTNYDSLLEDALREAKRNVDVKINNQQIYITVPHRDSIVYKMHGDKSYPNEAVIIKEDYEKYYKSHAPFITALNEDLISKTFLFLGISFTDPNINYVLSRLSVDYGCGSSHQHYALMKKVSTKEYKCDADYEYENRKQELFVADLKRYNVKVLLIDEYSEITDILQEINRCLNYKNVFISGSAAEYEDFEEKDAEAFISKLSGRLINEDFNVISGFGLNVGSAVIVGALHELYINQLKMNNDRLILRPFPQNFHDDTMRNKLYAKYREDMISRAGISIFMFGNKYVSNGTKIIQADGVMSEFEISVQCKNLIVPVGCTGFAAKTIWDIVWNDISKYYENVNDEIINAFKLLNEKEDIETMIANIIRFIQLFCKR